MASRQIRTLILCLFAVFAFSAVAAATASAKRVWTLEGAQLPVGEMREVEVVKSSAAELKAGIEVIDCSTIELHQAKIKNIEVEGKGPTGRGEGTIVFSKCENRNKPVCKVAEPIDVPVKVFLVEQVTGTPPIRALFRPSATIELTPKEVTEKGEPASKAHEEELKEFVKIKQTGTGCVANATAESDGVAAEFSPEGEEEEHKLAFPCPKLTPEKLWNGIEIGLKLKAFGVNAEECIKEVAVRLVAVGGVHEKWGVR